MFGFSQINQKSLARNRNVPKLAGDVIDQNSELDVFSKPFLEFKGSILSFVS